MDTVLALFAFLLGFGAGFMTLFVVQVKRLIKNERKNVTEAARIVAMGGGAPGGGGVPK